MLQRIAALPALLCRAVGAAPRSSITVAAQPVLKSTLSPMTLHSAAASQPLRDAVRAEVDIVTIVPPLRATVLASASLRLRATLSDSKMRRVAKPPSNGAPLCNRLQARSVRRRKANSQSRRALLSHHFLARPKLSNERCRKVYSKGVRGLKLFERPKTLSGHCTVT